MNDVPITPLKLITTKIGSGATPRGGKESYKNEGVSLIRSLNVYDLRFEYDGLALIDDDQAAALSNVEVQPKDILLNITGASVARCCMVPAGVLPARVNQHTAIVRVDESKADPRFVLYCLVSPQYKHHLLTLAQGGATREALTKSTIEDFAVPSPPLTTQRKIADILSAYDDLIENNTRRIQILEEMAQTIYREWFVNFRFPGHENVEMVETELGLVPKDWSVKWYTDAIDVMSGGTPSTSVDDYWNGPIPWCTPRDMGKGWHVLDTERHITELGLSKCSSKLYPANTVFITARGTVGRCVIAGVPMAMSQTSYALVGRGEIPQEFVFLMTLEQVDVLRKGATGAVFDTIVVDTFRRLPICIPPVELLKGFSHIVAPVFSALRNLQLRNSTLRQTRALLLPKLVSGEIDFNRAGQIDQMT